MTDNRPYPRVNRDFNPVAIGQISLKSAIWDDINTMFGMLFDGVIPTVQPDQKQLPEIHI